MDTDIAPRHRHGGFGIAAFVLAVVMAVMLFLDITIAGYAKMSGTATPAFNVLIGSVVFLCAFLCLISIGLGIAGFLDKTSKRVFPVISLAINGTALAILAAIVVLARQA